MKHRTRNLAVLLAGVLIAACSRQEPTPLAQSPATDAAAGTHAADIAWFDGSVEQAFAFAKQQGKPIFLYWGAAWCPPCNEIKATVFHSHEFIERSRLFVPVYLDGDSENAQAFGEKFGVVGYPTMIVFSPEGEEITRIPGGIDIQAYANVLDLTLANTRPVSALLAQVLDDGIGLTAEQCRLMAYYSWDQSQTILAERDSQVAFRALVDACPADSTVERSILQVAALAAAVDAARDKAKPVPLTAEQKKEALALVEAVLADDHLVRANLYSLLEHGAGITGAITTAGTAERTDLQAKFLRAFDRMEHDQALFMSERLYAVVAKIDFERIDDPKKPLPEDLIKEARDMAAQADATTTDVYERQAVIGTASYLLKQAGLVAEAKQLLLAELDKSKQPHYFMSGLASIEKDAGNNEAAIGWLKKAYDTATGPATRFQWGTYYINGLVDMTPDDVESIQAETVNVVRELEKGKAFYQRPKGQLLRLETKLEAWGTTPARKAGLARIRQDVLEICGTIPKEEPAWATCEGFLAPA